MTMVEWELQQLKEKYLKLVTVAREVRLIQRAEKKNYGRIPQSDKDKLYRKSRDLDAMIIQEVKTGVLAGK